MRRPWIAAAATACLIVAAWALVCGRAARPRATRTASPEPAAVLPAPAEPPPHQGEPAQESERRALSGLNVLKIEGDNEGLYAPTDAGRARLTLDPELQRTASGLLAAHHVPEGAVVAVDVATGRVLAYASHVEHGPARDLCAEATAPSASVFKIVTAAALVEDAHLLADTRQCYSGGEQRITNADLVDDPHRDRWCTTLAGAMGRSVNTVFARLAKAHLTPSELEAMAHRLVYGEAPAFDVPVAPSSARIPTDPLDFARTAAGFWNTTLSPLSAALLSAIVARGGETLQPSVVDKVLAGTASVWTAPPGGPWRPGRRAIARDTATQLATMMEQTVSQGTCWRAFHDGKGTAFLPGITVAGKTGTLTDGQAQRYYTWFTGFAPAAPDRGAPQIAIAVLVVNGPTWHVKANVIARDVLRDYFAQRGATGVTRPSLSAVARVRRSP